MSKKIILTALAALSTTLLAVPGMVAAQEIHLEPGNHEAFTVSGLGGELRAGGVPPITCAGTGGSGEFNAGSSTTGSMTLDYTSCHIKVPVFGTTAKCKSETVGGADNTIASGGTFHLVTLPGVKRGVLLTINHLVVVCAGLSKVTFTGIVIGTITAPACGASSKELSVSFTAMGTTQDHLIYTGKEYDLKARTGEGEEETAAWVMTWTQITPNAQSLNCTG